MIMKKILLMLFALPAMLCAQNDDSRHNFEVSKNLEIFNSLYRELDLNFVDTLNAEKNIGNAIAYMLSRLDPYTEYYTEEGSDELRQLTTGKYGGIGSLISVRASERRCIIAEPYEGMPAAEAGLRPGDILLAQDGVDYGLAEKGKEAEYSQRVSASLRGTPGTTFSLTVKRFGVAKPLTFKVTRRVVTQPSVPFHTLLADSIGFIHVDGFNESTYRETREALTDLKKRGARRIVLDLRANPGGLVSQAAALASLFLPKGVEVVSIKGRIAEANDTYRTESAPLDTEIPLLVMVDEGTASSAEILSGALQDYDRAVVVGQRTYGKGLVQAPRTLPYNTVVKLTTAKYYIPSGRCIQAYDYKDGRPQHLPDSLAREFHTAAGRPVRDAGGITPDIVQPIDTLPDIAAYFDASDLLYDFVADFRSRHATIDAPADFRLSDEEYAGFCNFMKSNGFSYDNRSKAMLELLRTMARYEGYADNAKAELDALEQKLNPGLDYEFDYWKDELRQVVERHIVQSYYYQRGAEEYMLRYDKNLRQALGILTDDARFRALLEVKQ